jgi:hypothetical protein
MYLVFEYLFYLGLLAIIVLQIADADVTDQTLDHLAGMANLRELDLNDSQI